VAGVHGGAVGKKWEGNCISSKTTCSGVERGGDETNQAGTGAKGEQRINRRKGKGANS